MKSHKGAPGNLAEYFTGDAAVISALQSLGEEATGKRLHVSNIVDGEGHQYVDLVMEGGGMLGIALVGYVHALESVGIRFLDIAGTSAGSLTALLLAAAGRKNEKKSEKLLEALATQSFGEFIDGSWGAQRFTRGIMSKSFKALGYLFSPFALVPLRQKLGIHPGKLIERWVEKLLRDYGVSTVRELNALVNWMPLGLKLFDGVDSRPLTRAEDLQGRLVLIAAEVTTETKVEFPRMAELFWPDPDEVNPARFVRASMSVPFFFAPMTVVLGDFVRGRRAQWKELGGFKGVEAAEIPGPGHVCQFIDGGIMSNFPINIFHRNGVPNAPTFGVKLGSRKTQGVTRAQQLSKAIFNSARHTLDSDFLLQNEDYLKLVARVDARAHNWLDFDMKREEQLALFRLGVQTGVSFLKGFDWLKYREVRKTLARSLEQSLDFAAPTARPVGSQWDASQRV